MSLELQSGQIQLHQRISPVGAFRTGPTPILLSLVDRSIPATVIALTLWACLAVYGEGLDLPYQTLMLISALLSFLVFGMSSSAERLSRRPGWSTIASISLTWIALVGVLLLLGYATKTSDIFSRRVLLTWFAITPPAIFLARFAAHRLLVSWAGVAEKSRRVIIAGANDLGKALASKIQDDPNSGMSLVGFFDDRGADRIGDMPNGRLVGKLTSLPDYARAHDVDVVFITLPIRNVQRVSELINELFDTTVSVYFIPDVFVFDLIQSRATEIGGLPAISLCETPFYGPSGVIKRTSDVILSAGLLFLLSPLLLLLAVLIKLTSPGSVIFKQRRYGLDGKEIVVYKFRSMRVSDDGAEIKQATQDDPRITSIGRILRKYSLDELPQLINVLQGRMSVVGPRPHAVAHNEEYRALIKGYMLRHKVRPGITGLAQVNGFRGETKNLEDMRKRVEYDLDYLRRWSLGLDLSIILKTVFVVFGDEKAY